MKEEIIIESSVVENFFNKRKFIPTPELVEKIDESNDIIGLNIECNNNDRYPLYKSKQIEKNDCIIDRIFPTSF